MTTEITLTIAKEIDDCDSCSSYIWINSSNDLPRLSIEKVMRYHLSKHNNKENTE